MANSVMVSKSFRFIYVTLYINREKACGRVCSAKGIANNNHLFVRSVEFNFD